jgi:intracellular multiplication protein IcmP
MQQPQQPHGQEGSLDFLWIIVLIIATILVIWYFGKDYIISGIFYVKSWEIIAVKSVLGFLNNIISFLHLPTIDLSALDKSMGIISQQVDKANFKTVTQVSASVGKFIRYPIIIILVLLAIRLCFGSISSRFKTIFTMQKLKDVEKVNWPRIAPVVNLNLVDEDINKGPWAMSMNPMQFCKKNDLLEEYTKDRKLAVSLKRGMAHRLFALQLGPLWRGNLEVLPEHVQALLAIFAARVDGNTDDSDALLDQIGASSGTNFSGARILLKKHINNKLVVKTISRHAYVMTMMAAMLDLSRGAGVLASADFLWLKPIDRKLWYVLNSVGRQTSVPEAAGVYAHLLVEQKLEYPIKTPMVDAAVNGLEEALAEIVYEAEEED